MFLCFSLSNGRITAEERVTVSILHFINAAGDDEIQWMARSLADGLTARLSSSVLTVVEREDLEAVLKEQKLGLSGLTDEKNALELGKILNVRQLVRGSYTVRNGLIEVNCRVTDTESGEILYSLKKRADAEAYHDLEAALAADLGEFYGIAKPGEGVSASREALRLYYQGLLSLDLAEYEKAAADFREALRLDPAFLRPRESLEESYRFLKEFRKARYQRELNQLYRRLANLIRQAETDPFRSWGDLVTERAQRGEDYSDLTARLETEPELSWSSTRAQALWHAQTVMWEIGTKAEEYFEDSAEASRMYEGMIAISANVRTELAEDPFLPEIIYQELLAWYTLDDRDRVIALCETLMYGWPDYRMMWAVEGFYEDALEEDPSDG
jgi:TolB-like protein